MSILALVAPKIGGRIGAERAVLGAVILVGVAVAGRLAAGQPGVLFGTTLVAGVGIAVAQTLLPAVVKGWFPERAALVTGLYTAGITGGLALAALGTVPIERALGGFWPGALATWSLLAAVAASVRTDQNMLLAFCTAEVMGSNPLSSARKTRVHRVKRNRTRDSLGRPRPKENMHGR